MSPRLLYLLGVRNRGALWPFPTWRDFRDWASADDKYFNER